MGTRSGGYDPALAQSQAAVCAPGSLLDSVSKATLPELCVKAAKGNPGMMAPWWPRPLGPGDGHSPLGIGVEPDTVLPWPAIGCCWRMALSCASPQALGRDSTQESHLQPWWVALAPLIFSKMH